MGRNPACSQVIKLVNCLKLKYPPKTWLFTPCSNGIMQWAVAQVNPFVGKNMDIEARSSNR
jgi:hypothetical protein